MQLLICWETDFAGKFVTVEGGYRDYFFRLNLNCFQPLYPILPYFSHSSNFPQECWEGEEPLTGTSNCYQSVIRFSLLLPSLFFFLLCLPTQACAQHCLQIRHLGDEWNLLPKSCDVLDFLRSEQLLQPPFHSLLSWEPFSLCLLYSLSLPLCPLPLCLSGYHLQFNAYLGWALTIASTMKWPRPCLHA